MAIRRGKVIPDSLRIILHQYLGKPEVKSLTPDGNSLLGESPDRWLRRVTDYRWRESDPTGVRYLAVSNIRNFALSPSDGMPTKASIFVRVLELPAATSVCEGTIVVSVHHRESDDYGVSGIAASPIVALCTAGGRTLCDAVNRDYANR